MLHLRRFAPPPLSGEEFLTKKLLMKIDVKISADSFDKRKRRKANDETCKKSVPCAKYYIVSPFFAMCGDACRKGSDRRSLCKNVVSVVFLTF